MLKILVFSNEAGKIFQSCCAGNISYGGGEESGWRLPAEPDGDYDLAFLDLDLKDWQERLLSLRLRMPVVAFSGPDVARAVEAMKLGACDYLQKPLTEVVLIGAIARHKKALLTNRYGFDEIVGTSGPMQEVFGLIKRAAASESNVLVTGESGTGKELIARAIHRWSPRSGQPFMGINCGAIPDTLLESELFGFEKGAFTGANYTKKGLMEMAHGGTVFFDEIGDVSPLFQIKVLRVIQEGEIMRVGGTRQVKVDVRIIAATNRDLRHTSQRGSFREDLYYRLNVINIHLPPLRDRMDDIPPLVDYFIRKHVAKRRDMVVRGAAPETMKLLKSYPFPGNVRELENIIERAISFTTSPEILPSDLPAFMRQGGQAQASMTPKLRDAVEETERETILAALRESGGNISRAASSLGIYRQQLQRKLRSLGIAT